MKDDKVLSCKGYRLDTISAIYPDMKLRLADQGIECLRDKFLGTVSDQKPPTLELLFRAMTLDFYTPWTQEYIRSALTFLYQLFEEAMAYLGRPLSEGYEIILEIFQSFFIDHETSLLNQLIEAADNLFGAQGTDVQMYRALVTQNLEGRAVIRTASGRLGLVSERIGA